MESDILTRMVQSSFFLGGFRITPAFVGIFCVFMIALSGIFSLFFPGALGLGIGLTLFLFFLYLLFTDTILFFAVLLPLRMTLDYFGEWKVFQMTEYVWFSFSEMLGILLFALGIAFFFFYPKSRTTLRFFFLFWIFLAWCVVSVAYSIVPEESAREVLRFFDLLFLVSAAFLIVRNEEDARRMHVVAIASAIIPSLFGLWQWFTGAGYTNDYFDSLRIYGTFAHPNGFGMFLFFIFAFSLVFFQVFSRTRLDRILSAMSATVSLFLLIPTFSRTAWMMVLFFVGVVTVIRFRAFFALSVLFLFLLFISVEPIQERVAETFSRSVDSSILWRAGIWKESIQKTFQEGRVVWGYGLEAFPEVISSLRVGYTGSLDAHNDYIKFFVEGGIVGILFFLGWMGWYFGVLCDRLLRGGRISEGKRKDALIFLFAIFGAIFVASFTDSAFKGTPSQWIFWILYAVTMKWILFSWENRGDAQKRELVR